VVRDWRSALEIDPDLEVRRVSVTAVRLTSRDQPDSDGDFRYEFAAALRRTGKTWPKGRYVLQAYDSDGLLIHRANYLELTKTLDKELRQLSGSFYGPALTSAELIFEPEAMGTADEWESVDVRVDEQGIAGALGIVMRGFKAEVHPDFEYSNLAIVRVTGQVVAESGLPMPRGLFLSITILGEDDSVLSTSQVDLSFGPTTSRAVDTQPKVYEHQVPACVSIEPFTA
jgi:hypothetical protein